MRRILLVCTGNTCRSPLAQAVIERLAPARGLEIEAASAGTAVAVPGAPPSAEAGAAAARRGYRLPLRAARPLADIELDRFHLVLGMTAAHVATLHAAGAGRARRLAADDIPDPLGRGMVAYDDCLAAIETACAELLESMAAAGIAARDR